MRFTINRELFLKSLNLVIRAIDSKNVVMPILSNFKLTLNEDGLFILGSNMKITIESFIPYKQNEEDVIRNYKEGEILANAEILTNIVRKIEGDEITIEIFDSTTMLIDDSKTKYNLQCIRAEEYGNIVLNTEGQVVRFTKTDFTNMINQTTFAASNKEANKMLTALNLKADNGILCATATNSARMAKKYIEIPNNISFSINVLAKTITDISHLVEETEYVDLIVNEDKLSIVFGGVNITTTLLEGEYFKTDNAIPQTINYTLEVNAQEFIKAIERVRIFSLERENIVDLTISDGEIIVSAKSSQIGSATDKITNFKFSGGDTFKISFNSEYIIAAIKALNSEDVTFSFVREDKPFVIENEKDKSVIQVATPVRTY